MLKKALLLVSGTAFGSAMLLVRNLLIARLISVEDYGVAATFAMSMAIVEMLSQFGLHQMIVQDKKGDDPDMQAGLQGFQVFRGVISGLLLLAISWPYAAFLGIEDVVWAYQVIAIIPVLNGLQHFDIHRLKRQMNFTPFIMTSSVPALVAVLVVWPLAWWLGDYRVMLVSLLVQAVLLVVVSHVLAERRYTLTFNRALIARSIGFGWPLLLNGVLLFGVFNGERLVVGRELGMATLAIFSMGFTLTLTPTLVLAGSAQTFFLPQLSAAQDNPKRFMELGYATLQSSLAIGVLLALGVSILGAPIVYLLLGEKYLALLPLLSALAIAQSMRVCKAGSAVVALAKAQTGNSVIANIPRVASLPVSWWIAATSGDLLLILWVATIGEVVGYAVSLILVHRRVGLALKPMWLPIALSALAFAVVIADDLLHEAEPSLSAHLHAFHIVIFLTCLAALASMSDLRKYVVRRGL